MKTTQKQIKKIIKKAGSRQKAAELLEISRRYLRYLEHGHLEPGRHLQKIIKMLAQ